MRTTQPVGGGAAGLQPASPPAVPTTAATSPAPRGPRQRILDAAGELFYRHGIGAVGVELISKAAGVSKRTLYQQFGSKDQLIAASLDQAGQAVLGIYLPPADDGDAAPREQILAAFDALCGWSAAPEFRGCPFINTAAELADPQHPARVIARDYKLRLREFFARQAERGGARDPQQLADQLLIVFDGAIVQAVMDTAASPAAARAAADALLSGHGIR
jgi:AcrR family transcriptional regulator